MNKKKIFFFTSSRSEFSLFKNLISIFNNSKKYYVRIIVMGSHLENNFGSTVSEIRKNFNDIIIAKKINNDCNSDSSDNFSEIIRQISKIIKKNYPNMMFLLGDRYETLAACIACYLNNITIAHIHGGELTFGSLDDGFRHSITKMSNIHFVTNKIYRKRVIQLGEQPKNVFNVGLLGAENIFNHKYKSEKNIEKKFNFRFKEKNVLITYHSNTLNPKNSFNELREVFESIKFFPKIFFIFTSSNSDKFGKEINIKIDKFCKVNDNCIFIKSFGYEYYYSVLSLVDIILGNSSSGVIEAPFFNTSTINIENRQMGRINDPNIINIKSNKDLIIKSIKKVYCSKTKKRKILLKNKKNTSEKIFNKINKFNFCSNKKKIFYDLLF